MVFLLGVIQVAPINQRHQVETALAKQRWLDAYRRCAISFERR